MGTTVSISKVGGIALLAVAVALLIYLASTEGVAGSPMMGVYIFQAIGVVSFGVVAWSSPRVGGWLLALLGITLGLIDVLVVDGIALPARPGQSMALLEAIRAAMFSCIILAGWILISARPDNHAP